MNQTTNSPDSPETELLVKANGLAYGGDFVCDILNKEDPRFGKKVFVREVIQGEEALVRIRDEQKRMIFADLVEVTKKSDHRISPACPKFGTCGGCDLQHVTLEKQLELKMDMFEKTLKFQGGVVLDNKPELMSDELEPFNYRRRVNLHINKSGEIGFYKLNTTDVVDIDYCHISSKAVNESLAKLRTIIWELNTYFSSVQIEESQGKVYLIFKVNHIELDDRQIESSGIINTILKLFPDFKINFYDKSYLLYLYSKRNDFDYDAIGHFSQTNEAANKILVSKVLELCDYERVHDFYAGSGNFSIPLAEKGHMVKAIEVDARLIEYGEKLSRERRLNNKLQFHMAMTEAYLKKNNRLSDLVLMDPPRSGAKILCEYLAKNKVKKILYVSCNLPSLARDLKALTQGGYKITQSSMLDMFPQTHHIETLTVLTHG